MLSTGTHTPAGREPRSQTGHCMQVALGARNAGGRAALVEAGEVVLGTTALPREVRRSGG